MAIPLGTRLALERAVAERNPRFQPSVVAGGVRLVAPGGLHAAITIDGARVRVGEAPLRFGVGAIGRERAPMTLEPAAPAVDGAEVQRALAPGVIEWWRSLSLGLEHGVTLEQRPAGRGALQVDVQMHGLVARAVEGDASRVQLVTSGDEPAPVGTYAHLYVYDARGEAVPASMRVLDGGVRIEVRDADARYPLVIDPLLVTHEAALTGANIDNSDEFGTAVAISASGNRAIVGVPNDAPDPSSPGTRRGTGRVFRRTGASTWTQEAVLSPTLGSRRGVGFSVAMDSSGSRVILGSPRTNDNAGVAFVFGRSGTTWTEEATLEAETPADDDRFAWSVALSGDGAYALIGARDDDTTAGVEAGSAVAFSRSGTTWTRDQTIIPTDPEAFERFGVSVDISPDGTRAIVGARLDTIPAMGTDPEYTWAGSARVFTRSGSTWTQEATLRAPSPDDNDQFGYSVALTTNADRAIIGVHFDELPGAPFAGTARVFRRSGTSWTQEAELSMTGAANSDEFGTAVDISHDGTRVLITAFADDTTAGANAGSARVFVRTGTSWAEETTLESPTPTAGDEFGFVGAISGDGLRALVGSPFEEPTGEAADYNSGGAHVFLLGTPLSPDGTSCSLDSECTSGECVDGVCCENACGGSTSDCQACTASLTGGADGTCAPILTGTTCRASAGDCDTAEVCDGSATSCPGDSYASSGQCRGAAGDCDVAESCDGSGPDCPTNAFALATVVCRPATGGVCDQAETCTGSTADCPTDAYESSGVCRPAVTGGCDVAESCDGSGPGCPADVVEPTTTVCRAGTGGPCARAERCDGSNACPADTHRSSGVCRAAVAGGCDVAESCDGSGPACPADLVMPTTTVCRAATGGPCAREERCDGSNACPGDTHQSSGVCRPAVAGGCDVADSCDGSGPGCPTDVVMPATTVCRADTGGVCDREERCDGSTSACPSDTYLSSGVCRPAVPGGCDIADSCDGSGPGCPTDDVEPASTVCRAAVPGGCDLEETCTGVGNSCPSDTVAPLGTECRGPAGVCDAAETCNGSNTVCPIDQLRPIGATCRDVAGPCDVAEVCTGGVDCPSDGVASSARVCRPALGECDLAEACDGRQVNCPRDDLVSAGTVCRAATGVCDVAEACGGASVTCPLDALAMDGSSCADPLVCNGDEVCMGGTCQMAAALSCDDTNLCTTDMCAEPGGCSTVAIPGCCNIDGDCDDGDVCTADACGGPGGACTSSPITACCEADSECDDMNACTAEVCDLSTNHCVVSPVPGCCAVDLDCDDHNGCTADSCDAATGACANVEIAGCCLSAGDCDDTNSCTLDACDPATNTCTNDALAGCCLTDDECGDADMCTVDTCNPVTATCLNDAIPSCCAEDADCDDADDCTTNRCDAPTSACVYEPIVGCGETDGGMGDAGMPTDAGIDAGTTLDAMVGGDASAGGDASTADGGSDPMDGGCGCRVQAPGRAPFGWLLLLGGLVFARRRRR